MERILDPKLLSHLHHSNQVQSQLKLSIQQFHGAGDLQPTQRKSSLFRLSDSQSNFGSTSDSQLKTKQNDRDSVLREHLAILLKLMDETRIMNIFKSFLSPDIYQIILGSYKAKKSLRNAQKSSVATK